MLFADCAYGLDDDCAKGEEEEVYSPEGWEKPEEGDDCAYNPEEVEDDCAYKPLVGCA